MRHRLLISLLAVPIASLALASCGQSKTVTVPNVQNKNVVKAYDVLHEAGLKVSIQQSLSYHRNVSSVDWTVIYHPYLFTPCVGLCAPAVVMQFPRADSSVARDSTVTLVLSDSPVLQVDKLRCDSQPEKAPHLIGKPLTEALEYQPDCLALEVKLIPPLLGGDRAQLFDNYIVSGQSPAPDALFPVISASNPPGNTTLTVAATAR